MQARCADDEAHREIPGSGEQRTRWPETHPHLLTLTPGERAVSDLIWALLAAPAALKLGFAFHNDLHQLVNSFPHLPVFKSLPVRLRSPRSVHAPALRRLPQQPSVRSAPTSPGDVPTPGATPDAGDDAASLARTGGAPEAASTTNASSVHPDSWAVLHRVDESEPGEGLAGSYGEGEIGEGLSSAVSQGTPSESTRVKGNFQAEPPLSRAPCGSDVVKVKSNGVRASSPVLVQEQASVADPSASVAVGSFLLNSFVDVGALEALCRGRSRQLGNRESLNSTTIR